jgi:hypothetical protein
MINIKVKSIFSFLYLIITLFLFIFFLISNQEKINSIKNYLVSFRNLDLRVKKRFILFEVKDNSNTIFQKSFPKVNLTLNKNIHFVDSSNFDCSKDYIYSINNITINRTDINPNYCTFSLNNENITIYTIRKNYMPTLISLMELNK